MFNSHISSALNNKMPVHLIQQPIERASLVMWLIAFAQFVVYVPGSLSTANEQGLALSWFLTAPVLMFSSIMIAIRSNNSIPLFFGLFSGAYGALFFFNPDTQLVINLLVNISNGLLAEDSALIHKSIMILGSYSLIFYILFSQFLKSQYFLSAQQWINNHDDISSAVKFDRFMFFCTFIVLSTILVFSLTNIDFFSLLNISFAIVFLFVSGQNFSADKRGILLPVYSLVWLVSFLLLQSDTNTLFVSDSLHSSALNSDLIFFVSSAFILWLGHNFISKPYNNTFPQLEINTHSWPWLGLILLSGLLFDASLDLFFEPVYLMMLMAYLFLILRNTTLPVISWSIVLLMSWILLVIWSPVNEPFFSDASVSHFGLYGQQSIVFCFSLMLFSHIWGRFINPALSNFGWQHVSFQKPAVGVSIVITMLWFLINVILVTGLMTGWYDLIEEGLAIEMTTVLVIASFILLSLFMNNQLLANLIHASLIFLIIVLWGKSKSLPVYTLFAMIPLIWVVLPILIEKLCDRFDWAYPEQFISASVNWVYLSFIVAIMNLLYFADSSIMIFESFRFFMSVVILFVASVIISKRNENGLWTVFSYLLAAGLILSLRFMLLGSVPVNVWDTVGVLIISLLLYGINRMGLLASPVIDSDTLVRLLPMVALMTIPWQTASLHGSVTLFLLGVFYLLHKNENRLSLYGGFILINMSVYLWMPLLSEYTSLMLFYVVPVSMSLILISNLHRDEVTVELQNKIRFIALSSLYLVVTADVFISSSLLLFFAGLIMGLVSTIYGISSKTRAYLYTGIGFIIINILGQLMVFYPDDRLGRALILMSIGAVITGLMVWFNIKREMLLSKIHLFRADLDQWK